MVLGLILLLKCAQILISNDLIEESLKLTLDLFKSVRVEAELIDGLHLLGLVGNGAHIKLDIVVVCHFKCFNYWLNQLNQLQKLYYNY